MDAIEDNKAFFVSTPAWHNLGSLLVKAPSPEEAWKIAYPHSLIECPIEAAAIDANGTKHYMPLQTHKAIIRDDGKHIGTVGIGYELEQPSEIWDDLFGPLLESGMIELESGGSLFNGSQMWGLAKLKGAELEVVKNDTIKGYLLAATSFDGSKRKTIKFCNTRVVCANTLAVAEKETGALSWGVKHTKNMRSRVENAVSMIDASLSAQKQAVETYRILAHKNVSTQTMKTYVRNVIAPNIADKDISPQMTTKVRTVIDLLDNQRGLDLVPAIRGTAWQAYNAVSEYITHHASRSDDTRLSNQWFDAATQDLNQRALQAALVM